MTRRSLPFRARFPLIFFSSVAAHLLLVATQHTTVISLKLLILQRSSERNRDRCTGLHCDAHGDLLQLCLGKPAFSVQPEDSECRKINVLILHNFLLLHISDGTNTDTVRRGVGVSERRIRHRERMKAQSERGERRETSVRVSAIRQKNYGGGRSKACWSGPCRFHHLFSPIRHYFPD